MRVITGPEVTRLLEGRETEIMDIVRGTYKLHDAGMTSVPHSTFLRFPGNERNRIIGLPAFVGGERPRAGMKWISSFPDNVRSGLERASASILLNSLEHGHPECLIEGSVISAKRTAASAAVAVEELRPDTGAPSLVLVGCGRINREVLGFLTVSRPDIRRVTLFDSVSTRAENLAAEVKRSLPKADVEVASGIDAALASGDLVSFATTAATPHTDLTACADGTLVLHLSLRDIMPEAIIANDNIVDDVDHVCRERTSLHLAELNSGGRDFVDTTLGAVIRGTRPVPRLDGRPLIFSPFGLGALDVALADRVDSMATEQGSGIEIDGFVPGRGEPQ